VQRGYKFTGPDAERNHHIYGLFRLGMPLNLLAMACGLTCPDAEKIIAEGNGGKLPLVYFNDGGDFVRRPATE
jgi:hypothetical protein